MLAISVKAFAEDDSSSLATQKTAGIPLLRCRFAYSLLSINKEDVNCYFEPSVSEHEILGVTKLLRRRFSTDFVFCYDYAHRKEEGREAEARYTSNNRLQRSIIARIPHADQTWKSGQKRLKRHLTEEEYKRFTSPERRCHIINFWKPISRAIQRAPLLLCDRNTLLKEHIVPCDVVSATYVGESVFLTHDASHRWYSFSHQQLDEAIIFQSFDSGSGGDARACFHTSCDLLHTTSQNLPPRESVEVRAIVVTRNEATEEFSSVSR